tara:strand:- start:139 stop:417 length:279 start_codon:yes stop_codon:yes gene_type:complete
MKKLPARSDCDIERITLHMDATTKTLLWRAADVSGLRLVEFIQGSAKARAQRLLSQSVVTRVSNEEFRRVLDAVENPPAPTDDLIKALSRST